MQVSAKFLINEFALFFFLTMPASSIANPDYMRKTTKEQMRMKHVSSEPVILVMKRST
jgi:hypothetical protein